MKTDTRGAVELPISRGFERIAEVRLATVHFNPCGYKRLRDTYYEWLPTLGPLAPAVKCYELVFDDDQPEIEGSTVLRGTRREHLMFQKEPLVNIALRNCGPEVKYFAWLDHDFVNADPDWLAKGVAKIDGGALAVQLLSRAVWLTRDRRPSDIAVGAVKRWKTSADCNGNPGALWLASRTYLDMIGGLSCDNIVGGGDQNWIDAAVGRYGYHLQRYSEPLRQTMRERIRTAAGLRGGRTADYLETDAYHLWHGEFSDRKYNERNAILRDYDLRPGRDLRIDLQGLQSWSGQEHPGLRQAVAEYFEQRREDGDET